MRTKSVSPATIVVVLLALLALTALTVRASFLPLPTATHAAIGLVIAVGKATLVVWFFMHVIHSPVVTRGVIVVALFWLIAVLMALTFSDYATREAVLPLPR